MTIRKKHKWPPEHYRAVAAMELGKEDARRGIHQCPRYYCSKDLLYDSWQLGQELGLRAMQNYKGVAPDGTA